MHGLPLGEAFSAKFEIHDAVTMDSPYSITLVDHVTWLRHAPKYTDYNYRQSWAFGTASAIRVGALSEHVAITNLEQEVIALADVRIRSLPVIGGGIAYINGGPLFCKNYKKNQHSLRDILFYVINALKEEYVLKRKLSLRIAPPLISEAPGNEFAQTMIHLGFTELLNKKKTILLDLTQDMVTIRKRFHPKWRNHLNRSEKSGLTLRSGKDESIFKEFIPLFNELVKEKRFSVDLDSKFYLNVQRISTEEERFHVILAEYEGIPVAGYVASILGDTCVYLLGAANSIGREMKATYLLQWKAIELGKAAGCCWYDLGGIDPEGNVGVYDFKKRMGGQERTMLGPYQINPIGARALLTQLGEKLYIAMKPLLVRFSSKSLNDLILKR